MSLRVRKISKRFGGRPVVQEVSFQVADGELVALLGPSGSGKSTILRIVAGLAPCDSGEVEVDGIDVTEEPPQRRDLGFVFQNYALFEHMTVAENIEFALRVRGVDRGERARRRDELLEQVGLGGSARKLPAQLSGGQRQRTALARALAHRPRLLLLDEPFGALDAQIRQELRHGLRTLLKDLGTTAIFVTHDQEEAFAVADRILVLHRGRLLEQGPPEELYHSPRTEFVARFVGRANVLPGELTPLGVRARIGRRPSPDALPQRVKVLYRPERLRLAIPDGASPPPGYELISSEAEVRHIEYLGASERIELAITSQDDEAMVPELVVNVVRGVDQRSDPRLHLGQRVAVHGTRPHAITSPSLRVLVVVDGSDAGRHLLSQALEFGERQHAVLTVIGDGLSRGGSLPGLEAWRQAFAGDLKLIDCAELGVALADAAQTHLERERYDLVLLDGGHIAEPAWFDLLRLSGVRHVLLAAPGPMPLRPDTETDCRLLVRRYCSQHPDLGLLGELLFDARARVEVIDLGGTERHEELIERSLAALVLRATRVSIAGLRPTTPEDPVETASPDPGLVAIDLGPRSRLGPAQASWLRSLKGRWTLLLVQPDEVDIHLGSVLARGVDARPSATAPSSTHRSR